jgi:hypothetical protein
MDFNPLTPVYSKIQWQLTELQQDEKQVAEELDWYNSLNPQTLEVEQRNREAKAEQLWREIQTLDQGIQEISSELGEIAPKIVKPELLKWLTRERADLLGKIAPTVVTQSKLFKWLTEQAALRCSYAELLAIHGHKVSQKQSKYTDLDSTKKRIASVANKLEQHRTFPLSDRQSELSRLEQIIADKTAELAFINDRKLQVDETIAPLLREMDNLESRLSDVRSDLEAAEDFDMRLSFADNKYDKAMIHAQCMEWFGEGSPQKVIKERKLKSAISQLERDYDKARRRVEDVAKKAARRIDKVVIDGNNICYKKNRRDFMGLFAIDAILPQLSQRYKVIIVFDSEICDLLKTDESDLENQFTSFAEVHVVASKQKADETVLDLASANEFTYVLSNDRFVDFNEKSAVKEDRLIRHEVVDGNVFVHDLQLRAAYHKK